MGEYKEKGKETWRKWPSEYVYEKMLIRVYMQLRKSFKLLRCTWEVVGKATDKKRYVVFKYEWDNSSSITFITVASLDCLRNQQNDHTSFVYDYETHFGFRD